MRPSDGSLRATQALFYELVVAPEGVERGLGNLGLERGQLEELIVSDERLDAVGRLDLYANMYFYRLLDVLRADYPKVLAVVGEAEFHNLATDYLLACRPSHPSIADAGRRLPEFLSRHRLNGPRPWLSDLARIEWARLEVYDDAEAKPLRVSDLVSLAADLFASLPLPLVPASRLLALSSRADLVWRAIEAGLPEPAYVGTESTVTLVWRKDVTVFHRQVEGEEAELISRLVAGAPFGALCEFLGETLPVDAAAQRAFEWLARWIGDELIAAAPVGTGSAIGELATRGE